MRVIENPVQNVSKTIEKENNANSKIESAKIEGGINPYRRKCTISDEMTKLLVLQIRHELANYNIYSSFAVYFNGLGLSKLTKYWEGRATEEFHHHQWIINYLYECDAEFKYPGISSSDINIPDKEFPFKFTVDREIETTGMIYNLINKAIESKDWATFTFLTGDSKEFGKLCIEQREEEKISRDVLKIVQSSKEDWYTIQDAVHDLYFNK